jgi:hypothetical protein
MYLSTVYKILGNGDTYLFFLHILLRIWYIVNITIVVDARKYS